METVGRSPVKAIFLRTVGFSDALDWRPLLFLEPVVAERACILCGTAGIEAVRLSCEHTVCSDCHAECVKQGRICPLDQKPFCEDDLVHLNYSTGYLGKRKVACWNAPSGCSFVGPVSSLLEHFQQCAFHTVSCPQCHTPVLRSNVVRHCREGCSLHLVTNTAAVNFLDLDRSSIEQAQNELGEAVGKISGDLISLQRGLNLCCEGIKAAHTSCGRLLEDKASKHNDLTVTCTAGSIVKLTLLRRVLTDVNNGVETLIGQLQAHDIQLVQKSAEEVKTAMMTVGNISREFLTEALRAPRGQPISAAERVSQSPFCFCGSKSYHWYARHWTVMKTTALEGSTACLESPTWNAFGYSVGLCLELENNFNFNCYFRIHPDSSDSGLEWPFSKSFVLGIIHPQDRSMDICHKFNAGLDRGNPCFQRPRGGVKKALGCGVAPLCSAAELEDGGFVCSNRLHMFLQVMP